MKPEQKAVNTIFNLALYALDKMNPINEKNKEFVELKTEYELAKTYLTNKANEGVI